MGENKKEGIELILDLAEALRVHIAASREQRATPPTTDGDERLIGQFWHWEQLAKEVVIEATRLKLSAEYQPLRLVYAALDRISALMALASDTPPADIAKAVEVAMKRLQDLELRVANFTEAATPAAPKPVLYERHGELRGVQAYHDTREEPRASYVLERMEALILGSWLGDAVKNLERVAEYMAANESRMSEDVFDELRRVAGKLSVWADEVIRGNMFPRST